MTVNAVLAILFIGLSLFEFRHMGLTWSLCVIILGYFFFGFAIGQGWNRKG